MSNRERHGAWAVTWRDIIVPLLAPENRTWTATMRKSSTNTRRQIAKIMNGEKVKPNRPHATQAATAPGGTAAMSEHKCLNGHPSNSSGTCTTDGCVYSSGRNDGNSNRGEQ